MSNASGNASSSAPGNASGIAILQSTYGRTDGLTKNLTHPEQMSHVSNAHTTSSTKFDRMDEAMSTEHGDRLAPTPTESGLSTGRHPDLMEFDRAVAEHEAEQLADELGYRFGVLTDGTILLEPPAELIPPIPAPIDGMPAGFVQLGYVPERAGR